MDTGQLLANGLDEQSGHDRGVHAAGQRQKHLLVAHLLADQLHLVGDKVLHIPVGLGLTCIKYKGTENLGAVYPHPSYVWNAHRPPRRGLPPLPGIPPHTVPDAHQWGFRPQHC